MSYTITRPADWWIYTLNFGFNRIGGCSREHAQKVANTVESEQAMPVMLFQAKDLYTIKAQVEKAIGWQQDVEYEHTENMRHDAERD